MKKIKFMFIFTFICFFACNMFVFVVVLDANVILNDTFALSPGSKQSRAEFCPVSMAAHRQ